MKISKLNKHILRIDLFIIRFHIHIEEPTRTKVLRLTHDHVLIKTQTRSSYHTPLHLISESHTIR